MIFLLNIVPTDFDSPSLSTLTHHQDIGRFLKEKHTSSHFSFVNKNYQIQLLFEHFTQTFIQTHMEHTRKIMKRFIVRREPQGAAHSLNTFEWDVNV